MNDQNTQNSANNPDQQTKPFRLGRPTKYKVGYCRQIIEYFEQPLYHQRLKTKMTTKNGNEHNTYENFPNPPIFMTDFAYSIGITMVTLRSWKKLFPSFLSAFTRAEEMRNNHIVALANMGLFNSNFATFTMKNISDWRDKKDIELSGKVDSQIFFANMLTESEEAIRNERTILGSAN